MMKPSISTIQSLSMPRSGFLFSQYPIVVLFVLPFTTSSYAQFQGRHCGVIYLQDVSLGTYVRGASQSLHASLDFAAITNCRWFVVLATKGDRKAEDPAAALREASTAWRKVVNASIPIYQVNHAQGRRNTLRIIQDVLQRSTQEQERVLSVLKTVLAPSGGRPELSAGFGQPEDIVVL